jgi:hypothetical protein
VEGCTEECGAEAAAECTESLGTVGTVTVERVDGTADGAAVGGRTEEGVGLGVIVPREAIGTVIETMKALESPQPEHEKERRREDGGTGAERRAGTEGDA